MISRLASIVSLAVVGLVGAEAPVPVPFPIGSGMGPSLISTAGLVDRLATPNAVDLSGRYVGILSGSVGVTQFESFITADMVHAGNAIIGTWFLRDGSGSSGSITGTVLGARSFLFEIRSIRPCVSVMQGSGVIEDGGAALHGPYGGQGCAGWIKATFRVERELLVGTNARLAFLRTD